jgi:hypothetical protein
MKTGVANLPLHYGSAPRWLFEKMTTLGREISLAIILEYGVGEYLKKISNPHWFQAFGCVLGFDWHSSGLTTTVCGALKEGLKPLQKDLGLFVCGGKGKASRKTPQELEDLGQKFSFETKSFVYASKIAAKVDNNALQDGYQLYHHTFFATKDGKWVVVQQGMNPNSGWARRYHWLSDNVWDFVNEPHSGIISQQRGLTLNLVASESRNNREVSTKIAWQKPEKTTYTLKKLKEITLPARHQLLLSDINPQKLAKIFLKTYERKPKNFEELLGMPGVGAKTIRALSLISEIIYGVSASTLDPARFSFAHGGKDGIPYPVEEKTYTQSIEFLKEAVNKAKIGYWEKLHILRRLC